MAGRKRDNSKQIRTQIRRRTMTTTTSTEIHELSADELVAISGGKLVLAVTTNSYAEMYQNWADLGTYLAAVSATYK
jgi:hypothetical protein